MHQTYDQHLDSALDTKRTMIEAFETSSLALVALQLRPETSPHSHTSPQHNPTISLPLSGPSPDSLLPPQHRMNDCRSIRVAQTQPSIPSHRSPTPPAAQPFPLTQPAIQD